jgi:hypothetical protein
LVAFPLTALRLPVTVSSPFPVRVTIENPLDSVSLSHPANRKAAKPGIATPERQCPWGLSFHLR